MFTRSVRIAIALFRVSLCLAAAIAPIGCAALRQSVPSRYGSVSNRTEDFPESPETAKSKVDPANSDKPKLASSRDDPPDKRALPKYPWVYRHMNHMHVRPWHKGQKPAFPIEEK